MSRTLALILALLAAPAWGQDVTNLDVSDLPDGEYPATLVVKGGKLVDARPLSVRTIKFGKPNPQPQPNPTPPTPTPVKLTDRGIAIKIVAEKVDGDQDKQATAKSLAILYREIAKLARDPEKVKDEQSLANGLKKATDDLLTVVSGSPKAWQTVRDEFGKHWTAIKFRGGSLADYALLLDEAADGLDASAPNRQIDPAVLDFILKLLAILLPIFFPR